MTFIQKIWIFFKKNSELIFHYKLIYEETLSLTLNNCVACMPLSQHILRSRKYKGRFSWMVSKQQVKSLKGSSGNSQQSLMIHRRKCSKFCPLLMQLYCASKIIKIALSCLCTCVLEQPHNAHICDWNRRAASNTHGSAFVSPKK